MFMPEISFSAENEKMASNINSSSANFFSKLMGFLRKDIVVGRSVGIKDEKGRENKTEREGSLPTNGRCVFRLEGGV